MFLTRNQIADADAKPYRREAEDDVDDAQHNVDDADGVGAFLQRSNRRVEQSGAKHTSQCVLHAQYQRRSFSLKPPDSIALFAFLQGNKSQRV